MYKKIKRIYNLERKGAVYTPFDPLYKAYVSFKKGLLYKAYVASQELLSL